MTSRRRVTLAQIARTAGVHVSTVSLALHNHPRIPDATRQRLQALAMEMGYVPDPMMRALVAYRRGMTHSHNPPTIAYITDWNSRFGWRKGLHQHFFLGAEAKAQELGYKLDHFWVREPGQTHARLSQILQSRGITGVVVASHVRESDPELRLDWSQFSAVKIDHLPLWPRLHMVTNDQLQIVRTATQKVIAAGYRRLGFVIADSWDAGVNRLWTIGFGWEQQALPADERIPAYLVPSSEPFSHWLRRTRPDVLLGMGDFVRPQLEALGLRTPDDIAFVDLQLNDASGAIAGVRQNFHAVGSVAVEILAGQLQQNNRGIPAIATTTHVEGDWFDGASCPFPAVAARTVVRAS